MGSRFRQTFQRWMPRAATTTGAASTTRSSPAGRPKSPDDSTPSGFDTASYWPIESLTNSQMTNLPFVFQPCEVVHPDACEASPKSHVQLYGPTPPLGCATRWAVSFTPARDRDVAIETVSGPPGGPRVL